MSYFGIYTQYTFSLADMEEVNFSSPFTPHLYWNTTSVPQILAVKSRVKVSEISQSEKRGISSSFSQDKWEFGVHEWVFH